MGQEAALFAVAVLGADNWDVHGHRLSAGRGSPRPPRRRRHRSPTRRNRWTEQSAGPVPPPSLSRRRVHPLLSSLQLGGEPRMSEDGPGTSSLLRAITVRGRYRPPDPDRVGVAGRPRPPGRATRAGAPPEPASGEPHPGTGVGAPVARTRRVRRRPCAVGTPASHGPGPTGDGGRVPDEALRGFVRNGRSPLVPSRRRW